MILRPGKRVLTLTQPACEHYRMFVLGHMHTVMESRAFDEADIIGANRSLVLMFPDMVSCHDWGYEHSWGLVGAGLHAELIIAHMLGDALVHYGRRFNGLRRKSGWAYIRMGTVARGYNNFFDTAEAAGWRQPGLARDSRRGWAHSLVEYSVDQYIADRRKCDHLWAAAKTAANFTESDFTWVHELVAEHVIIPSKPIETQPARYCGAVTRSIQPDEIHLRGLALKFGLSEVPECLAWLRAQLRAILEIVGGDEMEDVLASLSQVVVDPLALGYPLRMRQTAVLEQTMRWHLGDEIPAVSNGVGSSASPLACNRS